MYDDSPPQKVPYPDHPNRCQGSLKVGGKISGQCPFLAMDNYDRCKYCIAPGAAKALKGLPMRNYRLQKWQSRINELADSDALKTLNEEIGILRITLESIVDACQTPQELELSSTKISDLILKIEKLVSSCTRLELQTGKLLDKSQVVIIVGRMLAIVGKYITDPDIAMLVSNDVLQMIEEIQPMNDEDANS